jgi:hypothetical protein
LLGVRGGQAEEGEGGKGEGKGRLDAHGDHWRNSFNGLDGGAGGMLTAMAQRMRADVCCMNARVRRGRGRWQKGGQRGQPKTHSLEAQEACLSGSAGQRGAALDCRRFSGRPG